MAGAIRDGQPALDAASPGDWARLAGRPGRTQTHGLTDGAANLLGPTPAPSNLKLSPGQTIRLINEARVLATKALH